MNAVEFAQKAHNGQFRRDGKPYFTHVETVAKFVEEFYDKLVIKPSPVFTKEDVIAAAYLHDVIEDCGITKESLLNAGFSVATVEMVDALSRKPGESKEQILEKYNADRYVYFSTRVSHIQKYLITDPGNKYMEGYLESSLAARDVKATSVQLSPAYTELEIVFNSEENIVEKARTIVQRIPRFVEVYQEVTDNPTFNLALSTPSLIDYGQGLVYAAI